MSNNQTRADVLATKQALDLKQAAEYLGVSVKFIRRRIAKNELPAFRLGNRVIRVYLDDLENLKQPVGGGQ